MTRRYIAHRPIPFGYGIDAVAQEDWDGQGGSHVWIFDRTLSANEIDRWDLTPESHVHSDNAPNR